MQSVSIIRQESSAFDSEFALEELEVRQELAICWSWKCWSVATPMGPILVCGPVPRIC